MKSKEPVLIDFPSECESGRLLIRAPLPGDGKVVNDAILESFEELRHWMAWAQNRPSVEDSETVVRNASADFALRKDLVFFMFLKETGQFIGGTGLHRINWAVPKFEIGYWCRTSQTGKGYVKEAAARLATFAFEDLGAQRVEIRADAKNERSWRIPEKLGFSFEATLRNDARTPQGELRDTRVYSIVSLRELVSK
ncbi:MAG: GNAT family N-acetyltransferase [Bdellovibrionales bacterium]|nr:GNAT family N-acetyltransferase [Bdellovibrionales bacterium]